MPRLGRRTECGVASGSMAQTVLQESHEQLSLAGEKDVNAIWWLSIMHDVPDFFEADSSDRIA